MSLPENAVPLLESDGFVEFLYVNRTEDQYKETSLLLTVYVVNSWDAETNSPLDTEQYLRAFIKWDGCSHFNFGDDDGYLHICGQPCWDNHSKVMAALWELAKSEIGKWDPL